MHTLWISLFFCKLLALSFTLKHNLVQRNSKNNGNMLVLSTVKWAMYYSIFILRDKVITFLSHSSIGKYSFLSFTFSFSTLYLVHFFSSLSLLLSLKWQSYQFLWCISFKQPQTNGPIHIKNPFLPLPNKRNSFHKNGFKRVSISLLIPPVSHCLLFL